MSISERARLLGSQISQSGVTERGTRTTFGPQIRDLIRDFYGEASEEAKEASSAGFDLGAHPSRSQAAWGELYATFARLGRECQSSNLQTQQSRKPDDVQIMAPDPTKIFVIHGRDNGARTALFTFLRAIHLTPLEFTSLVHSTGTGSPAISDVLDVAFSQAQAVIALLTPDDLATLRPALRLDHDEPFERVPTGQARPNVLFELGMAFGKHPTRTIIVQAGNVRPFSDVAGRHMVRWTNDAGCRNDLARRLRSCGCGVNLEGNDWLSTPNVEITAPDDLTGPLVAHLPSSNPAAGAIRIHSDGSLRVDYRVLVREASDDREDWARFRIPGEGTLTLSVSDVEWAESLSGAVAFICVDSTGAGDESPEWVSIRRVQL